MSSVPVHLVVAGRLDDPEFSIACSVAKELSDVYRTVTCEVRGMVETEWDVYLRRTRKRLGEEAFEHKHSPLVYYNGKNYVGDAEALLLWAGQVYGYSKRPNTLIHRRRANAGLREWMASTGHDFVFMDFAVGDEPAGRVVFELFTDTCPRTSENFRALCNGSRGTSSSGTRLHYKGSVIHRVVGEGWVQGGDIVGGRGNGGESAFGGTFADESFVHKHDRAGVLSMANNGPHTNASQFFVTLGPLPPLDGKKVAFGRVISGMRTLRLIEKVDLLNQRPVRDVRVVDCGDCPSSRGKREEAKREEAAEEKKGAE
mmetsp:Transcript_16489/g.52496  ORF Transcript_16489/g.52496 Transcript_16489/m.52496 type:complete len:314 (-) Transcript_16489:63-1004(-)